VNSLVVVITLLIRCDVAFNANVDQRRMIMPRACAFTVANHTGNSTGGNCIVRKPVVVGILDRKVNPWRGKKRRSRDVQ